MRGIHESCQKALKKYLRLKTVLTSEEGAEVTVEPGFDPSAIKLVGNVTGEPPFRGILRHQGWRAEKVELPVLSGGQTPSIISPFGGGGRNFVNPNALGGGALKNLLAPTDFGGALYFRFR